MPQPGNPFAQVPNVQYTPPYHPQFHHLNAQHAFQQPNVQLAQVQASQNQPYQVQQSHTAQLHAPEPTIPAQNLLDIPFNDRWDILKPVLEALYHRVPAVKLSKIVEMMKDEYKFDANENQYKHRFSKWG
ncbi:uncharacterized protein BDZ99DRAFT_462725 [Mytilinidion resinicola]|uniref:Clr5 domain-containing protein n=1 Tax=Mytilinidion resinicola TaxID=574789 RepID=A0A6A6YML4_9PEZI|nr:uncharacterized protein BDZ99DRAFT_462725 [Mytilinidion resinicola]KAF2810122.1 hypothetical protein BDZ99DRAFT_462725 [Mytilinidion resinicola]